MLSHPTRVREGISLVVTGSAHVMTDSSPSTQERRVEIRPSYTTQLAMGTRSDDPDGPASRLAGGIGLTPFLSFIRDMNGSLAHDVDFYYTVRHPEEALFLDEIKAADEKNPRLKTHIRFSAKEGSLTIDHILQNATGDIKDYHVYMCGPLPMIQAYEKKFQELGLPKQQIHFEEFNFR